jgi:hypothetical protein
MRRRARESDQEQQVGTRPVEAETPELIFDPVFGKFVPSRQGPRLPRLRLVPRRPLTLSVLSMLVASAVAAFGWFGMNFTLFETTKRFGGANIEHAYPVALLGGLAGLIALIALRKRRFLLSTLLVFEAASLSVAVAFVELDRATYREQVTDTFTGATSTSSYHLWPLYLLWGAPIVVLLVQAYRVWGDPRRVWLLGLAAPFALWFAAWAVFADASGSTIAGVAVGETGCWRQVAGTPDLANDGDVYAMSGSSANELWAVGQRNADGDIPGGSLTIHWDGHSLRTIASPGTQDSPLYAVSSISATDAWAAGGDTKTLTEHWDGRSWRTVPTPGLRGASFFAAIAARSPMDVWAVGSVTSGGSHALIEHWDGGRWTVVLRGKSSSSLFGIAAPAAGNAWAVGRQGGRALILHWNGRSWRRSRGSRVAGELAGIAWLSATDAWVAGYTSAHKTLIEHWDGRRWQVVRSVNRSHTTILRSITAISPTNLLAWGVARNRNSVQAPFLERWNGRRWQSAPVPRVPGDSFLGAVAAIAPHEIWGAVKQTTTGMFSSDDSPLIERSTCF